MWAHLTKMRSENVCFEQFLMEEPDLLCHDKTVALLWSGIVFKNNDTYVE